MSENSFSVGVDAAILAERNLLAFAKENPDFSKSEMVSVQLGGGEIAYGRIVAEPVWSEFQCQYQYQVLLFVTGIILEPLAYRIRRVWQTKSQMAALLRQMRKNRMGK